MQFGLVIFLILLAGQFVACDKNSNLTGQAERTSARSGDRPQETGEGLPGYLACQPQYEPQVDGESGLVHCRLEADGQKLEIDSDEASWSFEAGPDIEVSWENLASSEDWHVGATFTGPSAAQIREAMRSSEVSLEYQGRRDARRIDEAQSSSSPRQVPIDAPIRLNFTNSSDGELGDWLSVRNQDIVENLIDTTGSNANLNWQISTSPGQSMLVHELSSPALGASPWTGLGRGALSSNGELEFSINGLEPGSYRVYLLSLAWIDFSGTGEQLIAADVWRGSNFERISGELQIARHTQDSSISGAESFTVLDFEGRVQEDGELRFIVRRLRPEQGPILVNAILIQSY